MKRLWLLSRLSSNRSTRFKRSSILPTDVQSEFPKYDLDFLKTIFCGLGLLFCRVSKGVSKNRSVRLCALKFVSCKRSSFRSKQAKLEIAATDQSLLGELTAPR